VIDSREVEAPVGSAQLLGVLSENLDERRSDPAVPTQPENDDRTLLAASVRSSPERPGKAPPAASAAALVVVTSISCVRAVSPPTIEPAMAA
jgi:hypothetical protein